VIGIELEAVNFSAEYKDRGSPICMRQSAAGAHAENPDVLCNAEIKFQRFLDMPCALGATRNATGTTREYKNENTAQFCCAGQ